MSIPLIEVSLPFPARLRTEPVPYALPPPGQARAGHATAAAVGVSEWRISDDFEDDRYEPQRLRRR